MNACRKRAPSAAAPANVDFSPKVLDFNTATRAVALRTEVVVDAKLTLQAVYVLRVFFSASTAPMAST